jgi:TRAP-type C4-dicarboxylate transport system substrate-binding protein
MISIRSVRLIAGTAALGAGVVAMAVALDAATQAVAQTPQKVNIRLVSDLTPPPHPAAIAQVYFAEELAKLIPGSTVRSYYAGALYKIPEAVEAMTDGNLEMTWGQFGKSAQIEPYSIVVNGPMLLTTPGAMNQIEKFETYKFLVKRFADVHKVKIFGTGHLSMYIGIGARDRLKTLEDFKGKKLRSMGPAENVALETWGSSAVTMAFGDVPPALETKVIDGLATSLGGFMSTKDQAPYFTIAGINGISGDLYWIGASMVWWNKLNKPTQQIIEKLMVEKVLPFQKQVNWCNDKRVIAKYETKDPTKPGIYILNADESEAFARKLGDSTAKWIKTKTPKDADKWVDKFVQDAKAASKAHPLGSDPLEKTDCAKIEPWFARFTKK